MFLDGDLCQMAEQKRFLQEKGFNVWQENVYPVISDDDKEAVLKAIWSNRVEGWWHYDQAYYKLGICTEEQFMRALNKTVEKNRD